MSLTASAVAAKSTNSKGFVGHRAACIEMIVTLLVATLVVPPLCDNLSSYSLSGAFRMGLRDTCKGRLSGGATAF